VLSLLVLLALFNIVSDSCYVECRFAERRGAKTRCQLNFLVTLRVLDTTETKLARFLISVEQDQALDDQVNNL
jgi:hypothetical protein